MKVVANMFDEDVPPYLIGLVNDVNDNEPMQSKILDKRNLYFMCNSTQLQTFEHVSFFSSYLYLYL